jgi:succinate-acetate transporter protein
VRLPVLAVRENDDGQGRDLLRLRRRRPGSPRAMIDPDGPPTRVYLRPIGSPVALGLSGLLAASLVVSGLELGWIAAADRHQVAIVLVAFAFPLQLVASLLAFAARDGAVGTALGVLAGTWLTIGLDWLASPPAVTSDTLGLFLLATAGLLAAAAAAAATGKLLPGLVFATAALRFALVGVYDLSRVLAWQHVAGVVGLVVVALAGYAMLAAVLEDARGRDVLPLGRRTERLDGEPGVRSQL